MILVKGLCPILQWVPFKKVADLALTLFHEFSVGCLCDVYFSVGWLLVLKTYETNNRRVDEKGQ